MGKYASKVVGQAKAWLGKNEKDGSHKEIIDVYNSHKPLARGYKVKYTDAWCATFVSAVAIQLGYTDIMPTECSCNKMIELYKKLGAWVENENRVPNPGDILFYDWEDDGKGDNTGRSDHVGIVERVVGDTITVIEGNYKNSVKRRNIRVNGKNIRGYGVPKYDEENVTDKLTVDGKWGKSTTTRLQQIFGTTVDGEISNQWAKYKDDNPGLTTGWEWKQKPNGKGSSLIKAMQKWAGMPTEEQDGEIGPKTFKAFQKKLGTTQDGYVSNPSQMVKALQRWANEQ